MNGRNEPVDLQAMMKALQDLPRLTEQIRDQMREASEQQMAIAVQADVEAAMPHLNQVIAGGAGPGMAVQAHHGAATVRMSGDGSTVTVSLAVRRLTAASVDRCAADASAALTSALHRQAETRQAYYAQLVSEQQPEPEDEDAFGLLQEQTVGLGQLAGQALREVVGTGSDVEGTATVTVAGSGQVRVRLSDQARRYRTPQELAACIEQGYAAAVAEMATAVDGVLGDVMPEDEAPAGQGPVDGT